MWEKLGYSEVDAGVLSKVINGKRLFTKKQLDLFCKLLSLDKAQIFELNSALTEDLLSRYSISDHFSEIKSLSDNLNQEYLSSLVSSLKVLRKEGKPDFVISLSTFFEKHFQTNPQLYKKHKIFLAKIYNEKSRAYGLMLRPEEVLNYMLPLNKVSINIGNELKNYNVKNMATMNIAGAYYVGKKYDKSAQFIDLHIKKVDAKTQLELIRTLLLNYAYLKKENEFNKSLILADKIMSKFDKNDDVASLLEAMVRGYAILGKFNSSEKLLTELINITMSPFFYSQSIRGELALLYYKQKAGLHIDSERIKIIKKEQHNQSIQVFSRHQSQIKKFLKFIDKENNEQKIL
jgi:hypothetical protein